MKHDYIVATVLLWISILTLWWCIFIFIRKMNQYFKAKQIMREANFFARDMLNSNENFLNILSTDKSADNFDTDTRVQIALGFFRHSRTCQELCQKKIEELNDCFPTLKQSFLRWFNSTFRKKEKTDANHTTSESNNHSDQDQ